MCAAIENPAKCEDGRTNIHEESRSGRTSVVSADLIKEIDEEIRLLRNFTISQLSEHFPNISRTVLYETVTGKLGYWKFCARWVPKMLTEIHKTSRMSAALEFLSRYHTDGEDFLNRMVTGDETWVAHVNVETKQQSMAWGHTSSPTRLRKARQTLSARKFMVTVFWNVQGILLIEFMTRGTTLNSEVYCRTLKKLKRALQNKHRGLLSSGVVLLHDNARPHTAVRSREVLRKFKWDVFQHPPYSPDLAPSDYHLFTAMKKWLGGKHFADDEELKNAVTHWFKSQEAAFYAEGIGKLVQRTATAGSDVVQSGRPIFDDIFQHLWPYIGNNTANVVFQMVKRLWLIRIDQ
ncbi:histone-lysine N-methyltransferase SETMAR [Trichonephila clavipes]|nr:histone-lysine N-methyltransferase SETMAR [Trichonephila clavipes]